MTVQTAGDRREPQLPSPYNRRISWEGPHGGGRKCRKRKSTVLGTRMEKGKVVVIEWRWGHDKGNQNGLKIFFSWKW